MSDEQRAQWEAESEDEARAAAEQGEEESELYSQNQSVELENSEKVTIVATKQDVEIIMTALCVYARAKETTKPHSEKADNLAEGVRQLLKEAFPPNHFH